MISVKLKFRPSVNIDKEGSLVFQLIHGRLVRRITSKYKIFSSEWDERNGCIILPMKSSPRYEQLSLIRFNVEWELRRINSIIRDTVVDGSQLCVDDVISRFLLCDDIKQSVFNFIRTQIMHGEFKQQVQIYSILFKKHSLGVENSSFFLGLLLISCIYRVIC